MLNQKRLAVVLVFLAVLPFVALCWYSHAGADDFSDAVLRREHGFWFTQRDLYQNLTGRIFTSVLLMEANPLVRGLLEQYWVVPLFTLSLMFSSLYAIFTVLLGAAWTFSSRVLAAATLLALWLVQNPSVAESVYWFNGLAVYTVPTALLVFWLVAFVRYWQAATIRRRVFWLLLSMLLGICVLWSNEIIALPLLAVVAGLSLSEWARRGPRRLALTGVLAWFTLALAASLLAPGNMARAEVIGVAVPWAWAILGTASASAYLLLNWTSSGVLLACTALALPALARLVGAAAPPAIRRLFIFKPAHILIVVGCLLLLLPLAALPSYWATGGLMPPRARASLYLLFLLGWFAMVLAGLVVAHNATWLKIVAARPAWPMPVAGLLWGWLLLNLLTDHNVRVTHRDIGRASNNVVLAYRDWLSGSAARYNAALRARFHLLRTTTTPRLQVAALPKSARPTTLLYYDVTTDTTCAINRDYAHFFNKAAIWAGPGGQGPPPKVYQPAAEAE